jgi:hypothetical protein
MEDECVDLKEFTHATIKEVHLKKAADTTESAAASSLKNANEYTLAIATVITIMQFYRAMSDTSTMWFTNRLIPVVFIFLHLRGPLLDHRSEKFDLLSNSGRKVRNHWHVYHNANMCPSGNDKGLWIRGIAHRLRG